MAGSPIKRARKAGARIPNVGGRPSRASKATTGRKEPGRELESDDELQKVAKRVLRNHAEWANEEKSRVAAARALAEVTRVQKHEVGFSFDGLSAEDIAKLEAAARSVLQPEKGEPFFKNADMCGGTGLVPPQGITCLGCLGCKK